MTPDVLTKVIALLWDAIPTHDRRRLAPAIEQLGATDALPDGALGPAWKSTIQLSMEFGLSPASIRTNWPRQYGIRPTNDRWLCSDIEKIRLTRRLSHRRTTNV